MELKIGCVLMASGNAKRFGDNKLNKKDNMKQAMYEMFGVGSDQNEKAVHETKEESKFTPHPTVAAPQTITSTPQKAPASYLAPGTVLEGTLRSEGDVEIGGTFKGNITSKGTVILRSGIHGNITAKNLNILDCDLVGDVVVSETVTISPNSSICGNVTAKEVKCAGSITGDLNVSENTALETTAQINGNIATGYISVVKGAVICGGMEIKPNSTNKNEKSTQHEHK